MYSKFFRYVQKDGADNTMRMPKNVALKSFPGQLVSVIVIYGTVGWVIK